MRSEVRVEQELCCKDFGFNFVNDAELTVIMRLYKGHAIINVENDYSNGLLSMWRDIQGGLSSTFFFFFSLLNFDKCFHLPNHHLNQDT